MKKITKFLNNICQKLPLKYSSLYW
jgi:hypothetical protein